MEYKTISKADFRDFVNRLIQGDREINGVVTKGTGFIYDTLEDAADLCLDYDETLLSPKKYFLPVKETLLTFKTGDPSSYHESVEATPRIVIGIHPWDLAAIAPPGQGLFHRAVGCQLPFKTKSKSAGGDLSYPSL